MLPGVPATELVHIQNDAPSGGENGSLYISITCIRT